MTEKDIIPQSYWKTWRWALEHSTELHQQYEDVWIAIVEKQVVASGSNPVRLREIAAQKTQRKTEEVVVKFIESGAAIYGAY